MFVPHTRLIPPFYSRQVAGLALLDSSEDYHGYPPAEIYSSFYRKPGEITNLKPGGTIMLPSQQLVNTGSKFYFFKQYPYMKERIMRLRQRPSPAPKNKDGVIVTGTPGIGRMRSTLSYSSNSFCRQIHLPWKLLRGIPSFIGLLTHSISSTI